MDKGRHPHVVRTWTVERTKVPYLPPQPVKAQRISSQDFLRRPDTKPPGRGTTPKRDQ
jgi:hypothetical protein